jgi:Cu+-exporting ATPase
VSGTHEHSHEPRPQWLQFALIGAYGVVVLLCWVYRDWLTGVSKSLYGLSPVVLIVLLGGYRIFYSAVSDLLRLRISADLAVAIAAIAALAIGENFAAAEVIFIMLIGGALEEVAVDRTERSIRRLVELAPETARVRREGAEEELPVEDVRLGDTVLIRPGERVPVDGVVTAGRSSVNEATITGEPLAVSKSPGDEVHAGTVSEAGALEIEATRVGDDTTLARIARLVQEAQERKGAAQQRADRWATWFVPVVLAAATLTWIITKQPVRAVAVLVVACPCALVLATPTAVVAAIGRLARAGVLIRGGGLLEALASADTVAFDKTGTVTRGEPAIAAVLPLGGASSVELLGYAASAEQPSEHALARLIVAHAAAEGATVSVPEEFEARPGAGVVAKVGGKLVIVGKAALLEEAGCEGVEAAQASAEEYAPRGAMLAFCAVDGRVIGFIAAEDAPRDEAAEAVEELAQAGVADTLLLTGDHERAARAVCSATGIAHHHAGLLPDGKTEIVRRLQERGRVIIAVGDGVNDAPMLATAAVGVAMGDVATDITADAADVILARADLRRIAGLVRFSRRAMATIRTNVFWFALLFNGIGVALSARGILGPVGAAIFHQIASLLVVCNSLRLLTAGRLEERGRVARAWETVGASFHALGHQLSAQRWRDGWGWLKARRGVILRYGTPIAVVLYLGSGLYMVRPAEVAVVRRWGAQSGEPRQPGLHYRLPWPVDRVVRVQPGLVRVVEVGYRSLGTGQAVSGYEWESPHQAGQYKRQPEESLRLTGDENLIDLTVAVHYVIRNVHDYLFHVSDEPRLARVVAEAAVRDVVGRSTADEVMTDSRLAVEGKVARAAQGWFGRYECGLQVTDVRLRDVHPPVQVVPEFREVASAMEEKRSEINRAEGYAKEQVPKAKGQASAKRLEGEAYAIGRKNRAGGDAARFRQLETAHRQAPNVVEIRLQLEALERALADREKLILSGRSGARRQMWLLDAQGVKLQPGVPGVPTLPAPEAGAPPAQPPETAPQQPRTGTSPAAATTPDGQTQAPPATQEGSR